MTSVATESGGRPADAVGQAARTRTAGGVGAPDTVVANLHDRGVRHHLNVDLCSALSPSDQVQRSL